MTHNNTPDGNPGGGTQICFGRGCAAEAPEPIPMFMGDMGKRRYPYLGLFCQEATHL